MLKCSQKFKSFKTFIKDINVSYRPGSIITSVKSRIKKNDLNEKNTTIKQFLETVASHAEKNAEHINTTKGSIQNVKKFQINFKTEYGTYSKKKYNAPNSPG